MNVRKAAARWARVGVRCRRTARHQRTGGRGARRGGTGPQAACPDRVACSAAGAAGRRAAALLIPVGLESAVVDGRETAQGVLGDALY